MPRLSLIALSLSATTLAGCGPTEPQRSPEELTKMQNESQQRATDDEKQMIKERDTSAKKTK